MKKTKVILTIFILSICLFPFSVFAQSVEPKVSADSAVLMDATTGEILYSKNADKAYPPASTTKIMTALLTLERCSLDDTVTIGKTPPLAEGSKIYLIEGEKLKVRDLLYALLLESANDSAEALAEHISGNISSFAKEMNSRAKELGCENTNFVNPSGLYNPNHKISSKDLALIMRELMKHQEYSQIAKSLNYTIKPSNKSKEPRYIWNKNKLVIKGSKYYLEDCEGGKTGYTIQSQHSYVASACRNNHRIIVALVHDKNKTFFEDSFELFNYGFNNFELVRLCSKGEVITKYTNENLNIPLVAAEDFYYIRKKENCKSPNFVLSRGGTSLASKSFKSGDTVLNANIVIDNKSIGTIKLNSGKDHKINSVKQTMLSFSNNTIIYLIPIALLLLLTAGYLHKKMN
ncbi:D-alanyl-D-alanine carboxypeptidase DacB precursor [Clostridium acetireducens DSM 10703]|jgi:D-alanyl-D-alanine carboxypeptidase (penicillin-binding protein 5/6)|uniref:serine-type D-Ala-D-Ala carboxypeptidase n=1 Tax=Clostridium acetireducens DSM 10703 TaxID=1121290 RepID=A0A1E8F191_9CLOT|nr:serine hydrolase [Clostridium acetireducens]OFI07205.1 D-alanyl-D-alanine carboxypeptidase DacB precursor [Clostridium acetireducens DSM 10703]